MAQEEPASLPSNGTRPARACALFVRYSLLMGNPNKLRGRRTGRPPRTELYKRLQTQIAELRDELGGLPSPLQAEEIWRGIWLEETHNSTAIEGNTLALKQVEVLLAEGRAVGSKDLGEYLEVRGYATAAEWVYGRGLAGGEWDQQQLLTLTEVRYIHELTMAPVWEVSPHPLADPREAPGAFRAHDIASFPGGMKPPPWTEVPALMKSWIAEANGLVETTIPEGIAELHAWFERIHPFLDGNGRTGRLIANLLLVRLEFPPAIVYKRQRGRYLDALRRSDASDPGPLGELLARAMLDNLHRFVIPTIAGPDSLVPLPALAVDELSANALRVAAVRGRLKASKGTDGTWRSSRAWVDEYRESRYKRE